MADDEAIVLESIDDPTELAAAHAQDARFQRNSDWFERNAQQIFRTHRGRYICVAGEELFVGDSAQAVVKLAQAAHPEDNGFLMLSVPLEKVARIYDSQRFLDDMR